MTWIHIARKDLLEEARAREGLVPILLVALGVLTIGLLAFHDAAEADAASAGVLWMGLALATGAGLARAFGSERDRGTLDTLLTLPFDRGHVVLGKTAASWAVLLVASLALAPALLLARGDATGWVGLALILVLGTLGLAATGTMLSALVAQARARDVLLPVLLLPLLVPVLLAGVHGTMDALAGEPFATWRPELLVLAGYDVAFVAASWLLFEEAVA